MNAVTEEFTNPRKLNWTLAQRAFAGTHRIARRTAQEEQAAFASDVNSLYAQLIANAKTDEGRAAVTNAVGRYERNYLYHRSAYLRARAEVNDPQITGKGLLDEATKAVADAKLAEFTDWRDRARTAITRELSADFRPVAQGQGIAILVDAGAGRAQVKFDEKPEASVRTALKDAGWRWASAHSAWEHDHSPEAVEAAKKILGLAEEPAKPGFAEKETARRGIVKAGGRRRS